MTKIGLDSLVGSISKPIVRLDACSKHLASPSMACLPDRDLRLTVRLLSGFALEVVTKPSMRVLALKLLIERAAQLPQYRVVRSLVWDTTELPDEASLQELGMDGGELLALLSDVLVGDFEFYLPGCPTCDYMCEIQSVRFFADGTALIQTEHDHGNQPGAAKFHYKLGELKGEERELEFVEADLPEAATEPAVYTGTLYVSSTDPMYRRVKISGLDIDVEDVQYLKRQARTALHQKLQQFFENPMLFGRSRAQVMQYGNNIYNPSAITSYEEEVREVFWWNWPSMRDEEDVEEAILSLADSYDWLHPKKIPKKKEAQKRREPKAVGAKAKAPRWM